MDVIHNIPRLVQTGTVAPSDACTRVSFELMTGTGRP